jgi:hypothetical protein
MSAESITRFKYLLGVMMPRGWMSGEGAWLGVHSLTLVSRSFLSLYVAHVNGLMVKAIVDQDATGFMWTIARWIAIALYGTTFPILLKAAHSMAAAHRPRSRNLHSPPLSRAAPLIFSLNTVMPPSTAHR